MPFYKYACGDETIEELFSISERPDTVEKDGKVFEYVPEFGGNFILKGMGWASKGTALASKPKKGKEVGIKVDNDKKKAMEEAGDL